MDDQELLRQYASEQSKKAFADLVARHINLVYSVALRIVQDTGMAKDRGADFTFADGHVEFHRWIDSTIYGLVLPKSFELKSSAKFRKISPRRVSRLLWWPERSRRTSVRWCR